MYRPFILAALVAAPAFAQDTQPNAAPDAAGAAATEALTSTADLIRRHHEGDVAMGVCGARFTALMWFYRINVDGGRAELQSHLDWATASRDLIKAEAERRATNDGVDTTVRVMNDHSDELLESLFAALKDEDGDVQGVYDMLQTGAAECQSIFFSAAVPADGGASDAAPDAATDAETPAAPKAAEDAAKPPPVREPSEKSTPSE